MKTLIASALFATLALTGTASADPCKGDMYNDVQFDACMASLEKTSDALRQIFGEYTDLRSAQLREQARIINEAIISSSKKKE